MLVPGSFCKSSLNLLHDPVPDVDDVREHLDLQPLKPHLASLRMLEQPSAASQQDGRDDRQDFVYLAEVQALPGQLRAEHDNVPVASGRPRRLEALPRVAYVVHVVAVDRRLPGHDEDGPLPRSLERSFPLGPAMRIVSPMAAATGEQRTDIALQRCYSHFFHAPVGSADREGSAQPAIRASPTPRTSKNFTPACCGGASCSLKETT